MFHPVLASRSFMRIIISFHVFEITKTGGSFILIFFQRTTSFGYFKKKIFLILKEENK
jgi:hypothetical protein